MCDLIKEYKGKQFIGYKIAYKKKNGYYSIAMGTRYRKNGKLTIPKKQNKICGIFSDLILSETFSGFNKKMVGRTAAFKRLKDAKSQFFNLHCFNDSQYVILKIKLTEELLKGTYGWEDIVAGKNMEILEEVKIS
jgi:hypothetical protein